MKNKTKILLLMLGAILVMSLAFGCAEEVEEVNNDDDKMLIAPLNISAGFINDKYVENETMIIEFGYKKGDNDAYEGNLVVQTNDSDLFDQLDVLDHYMITYDDDNNLLSIETNEVIKDLMEDTSDLEESDQVEDTDNAIAEEEELDIISSSQAIDMEGLTLLNSYSIDIYGDEGEEKVEMYVDAEKDAEGNIMWDDGQNWKLIVEGDNYSFVLFEDYLQLSSMDFFVYKINEDLYISTVTSGTANLTMTEYKYDPDNETFEKTIKSDTSGNVNMMYKSNSDL